jgi:tRNA modification GTPase
MFDLDDAPIIARATGTQTAALAVIRVSGIQDLAAWAAWFSVDLLKLVPRQQTLTKIQDPTSKQILDQGLITLFPAPHSYTGENILELTIHGNPHQVQRIMQLWVQAGLGRYAQAGEFTKRAIKNKKMTLAQAEGLDLFFQARSAAVAEQGLSLLFGGLYEQYWHLRQAFIDWTAAFNLFFDFLEDVGTAQAQATWQEASKTILSLCQNLASQCQHSWENFVYPTVLLLGPPNAGKSSLFNALLNTSRAIVHNQAGTTRDYLAEDYTYEQTTFKLIDTAGIWAGQEIVEQEGIKRSLSWKDKAFYKILVLDPTQPDLALALDHLKREHFNVLVLTHADYHFAQEEVLSKITKYLHSLQITFAEQISLDLKQQAAQAPALLWPKVALAYQQLQALNPIAVERHRQLILEIYPAIQKIIEQFGQVDLTILEMQIKMVGHKIEELVGIVDAHEIINQVLSNFCIGK